MASSGRATSMSFLRLFMFLTLHYQAVRCWVELQPLLLPEFAQADPSDLDGVPLDIRKNQGVKVRAAVDQAPNVCVEHKRRSFEAVVLRPVVPDDAPRDSPALPREPVTARLGNPSAVGVEEAILTVLPKAMRRRKAFDDTWLAGFRCGPGPIHGRIADPFTVLVIDVVGWQPHSHRRRVGPCAPADGSIGGHRGRYARFHGSACADGGWYVVRCFGVRREVSGSKLEVLLDVCAYIVGRPFEAVVERCLYLRAAERLRDLLRHQFCELRFRKLVHVEVMVEPQHVGAPGRARRCSIYVGVDL